ncbi:hypothetical protein KAW50_02500, partial [candidate division WOR-3 bacterium]|nr:hypothetical protein [candidate division WOR-3 bacterium]
KDIEQTIDKKSLISIIAPRIEEIFGLLHRKLKYPTDLELLPAGIVLTGGAAKMPGISGLAERIFGIPAKIGIPNTVQSLNQYKDPSFATPIGLIIYGSIDKSASNGNKRNGRMGKASKTPLLSSFSNRVKKWLLE